MFQVGLTLERFRRDGLEALDLRRRLGLPDDTMIWCQDCMRNDTVYYDVPEEFARLYFDPQQKTATETVTFDMLRAGDLVVVDHRSDKPVRLGKTTTERAIVMWVAARTKRLERRIAELEEDLIAGTPAVPADEEVDA